MLSFGSGWRRGGCVSHIHILGNTLTPVGAVADRLAEIPTDTEVIIYCHSGVRSAKVFNFLKQQGYTNIHNMQGEIVAWQGAGFDVERWKYLALVELVRLIDVGIA